ncbi:MAG: PH domain-containing protein [Anaerolineales bacterium]
MKERYTFHPPRKKGNIFHFLFIATLIALGIWGIWQISNAEVAPQLLVYLLPILLFLLFVPFLIYRLYALHRSQYILDRDGLILQWGWRKETIPMDHIEWVHQVEELNIQPKPPLIRWPGAVLGKRRLTRGPMIEFLASRGHSLVIISKEDQYYAISPQNVESFINTYNHLTELGSLNPLPSQDTHPAFLITQLWKRRANLMITFSGFILVLSLLVWALNIIPNREEISLGFSHQGDPHQPLPSVRLILLPILYTISYFGNLVIGLFLYRREKNRSLAYFLWGSSVFLGLVFHISMYFITT